MNKRFSSVVAGVGTLVASAGIVLASGTAASAAAPGYEPDPYAVGTISFYDASGNQITSGTITDSPFAAYAVGSKQPNSNSSYNQALLEAAQPNPNQTNTALWNKDILSGPTNLPITSGAPSNIETFSQTQPVVAGASGDETLKQFLTAYPNTSGSYANLYQLRLETSNGSSNTDSAYDVADVMVSGNTWTQVYPTVLANPTVNLSSSKNPATVGDSITYTAAVSGGNSPTGTVKFTDGGTTISGCGAVALSGGSAQCSTTAANPTGGHAIVASYSGDSNNNAASGSLTENVNPPATPTTTTLGVSGGAYDGDSATFTATVKDNSSNPVTAGSVSFYDSGSSTPLNPSPVTSTTGTYTYTWTATAGSHSIVAKFTPTNVATYQASQSAPQSFVTQPKQVGACANSGSSCSDTQYIQGTIPVGTLNISTPYTQNNPLDLGTLALNSTDSMYTASKPFHCITVTDLRSGGAGFTASALASNLSNGGSSANSVINNENVGLTQVAPDSSCPAGTSSYSGTVTPHDNPAAAGVAPNDSGSAGLGGSTPHTVLTGSGGVGTTNYGGTLTLNAPTSTAPGLYTGTITFTVG